MSESFDYWDLYAAAARRAKSPLYARLAEGIAKDANLREFAATARKGQPHANMLLAPVHLLLLRGAQHPLRRHYPNLNNWKKTENEDPFPDLKDFVELHRAELAPIVAGRITNTNEVGRSALLHAGFRMVAAQAGEPLHLIELGPSAGLNLIWDRYGVRYIRGAELFVLDVTDPTLIIDVRLLGSKVPPLGPSPKVASRVGLELNPVDISDRDERDWLKALTWPEHKLQFERLELALNAFALAKPQIRVGDALALLPNALREAPEHQPVCVYHTYVTYQFTDAMRDALDNILSAESFRRPVWRLSVELSLTGEIALLLQRYQDGVCESRKLARCDTRNGGLGAVYKVA
jgi:hypothetical protein